ncbi:Uncharacterized conserved protein [Ceraceosorus bombacis]|uniref:Uncharacterized conserved protein n=1 Tax=Ceraceosorus bombacis TaxID=401625 RepID=A0A0P1BS46_9BASI|nr:Uncharacterized conserved protein [Ceraceosorus bombacis]
MGADGGSIAGRSDMVRVRAKQGATSESSAASSHAQATTCRLSGKPLRAGKGEVVADALGRMYNKEEVLMHLAERAKDSRGPLSHVKRLSDVTVLNLTPSKSASSIKPSTASSSDIAVPFACPLTSKSLNGKSRFIYLTTCGCVMSESGLIATVGDARKRNRADRDGQSSTGAKRKASAVESDKEGEPYRSSHSSPEEEDVAGTSCPVCGKAFTLATSTKDQIEGAGESKHAKTQMSDHTLPGGDVIVINPDEAEEQVMRGRLDRRLAMEAEEKAKKKAAKRAQADLAPGADVTSQVVPQDKEEKRIQKDAKRAAKLAALAKATSAANDLVEPDLKRARLDYAEPNLEGKSRAPAATSAAAAIARLAKESAAKRARGEGMSEAMKQVYGIGQERKKTQGSDWMTKGTFNRFA